MRSKTTVLLCCLLMAVWLLQGCSSSGRRSVAYITPQQYLVKRGDTLSSIAWRFQLDYRSLASWNRIPSPYTIHPGQRLYLSPPQGYVATRRPAAPASGPAIQSQQPSVTTHPYSPPAASKPRPIQAEPRLAWQWPVQGHIVRRFSVGGSSGLDIRGVEGAPVVAAAAGSVVYSGSGLKGYGELVIIKHSDSLLSAYAHNRVRFVKEGDVVKPGQRIAELGKNNSNHSILHFEIRRNGKPVDPIGFLPRLRQ